MNKDYILILIIFLLFIFIISLLLYMITNSSYKNKYLKYKNKYYNLKKETYGGNNNLILKINNLYKDTPSIYGIQHNVYDTTYGELHLDQLDKVFSELKINSNDVFYDLGCGSGKINLFVAEKYKIKSIGIEIIDKRYDVCKSIHSKVNNKNLYYYKDDILKHDLSNGTIFYTYNLTWGDTINNKIVKKIKTSAKKCKYIISSVLLKDLKLFKTIPVKFSSHDANLYVYTL